MSESEEMREAECCPDCGQPVCRPGIPGVDQAWKQHFDVCEPHRERVAFEEFNLSQDGLA